MIELIHQRLILAGRPGHLGECLTVCRVVLRRLTDGGHEVAAVGCLCILAAEPLHELPGAFLILRAVHHNRCGNRVDGIVVDAAVLANRTRQRNHLPQTIDFGCENRQLVVGGGVVRNQNRHLTGSETVRAVEGEREGIVGEEARVLLKCVDGDIGIEAAAQTVVCKAVAAHLIEEDVVLMVETDRHVVCLQHRQQRQHIVPGLRNFQTEVGKHINTDKHHVEACALRQTVSRAVERDRNGRCLIELADGFIKARIIVQRKHRAADCIVDDIHTGTAEERIGALSRQDRGKQRARRNQFDIHADFGLGREVIGDEVLQDLRLV